MALALTALLTLQSMRRGCEQLTTDIYGCLQEFQILVWRIQCLCLNYICRGFYTHSRWWSLSFAGCWIRKIGLLSLCSRIVRRLGGDITQHTFTIIEQWRLLSGNILMDFQNCYVILVCSDHYIYLIPYLIWDCAAQLSTVMKHDLECHVVYTTWLNGLDSIFDMIGNSTAGILMIINPGQFSTHRPANQDFATVTFRIQSADERPILIIKRISPSRVSGD